jgi:hypothetical protein
VILYLVKNDKGISSDHQIANVNEGLVLQKGITTFNYAKFRIQDVPSFP